MVWVLGILYMIVGAITVVLILLHSGRGGGMSDMFGGGLGAAVCSQWARSWASPPTARAIVLCIVACG